MSVDHLRQQVRIDLTFRAARRSREVVDGVPKTTDEHVVQRDHVLECSVGRSRANAGICIDEIEIVRREATRTIALERRQIIAQQYYLDRLNSNLPECGQDSVDIIETQQYQP